MDDTRLLELAGRAAGENYGPNNNPLDRDDLALRLAVKLRLSISIDDRPVGVVRVYVPSDSVPATDEPTGGDLAAATRRAIVRAAAAMAG